MAHYRDSISDYESFQLGDFELQCGEKLPNAQIAYKTLGSLNADKSNVIILNHPVGGTHGNAEAIHLDGENRAIFPKTILSSCQICLAMGYLLLHQTPQHLLQDRRFQV